jgi:ssRNA-specific RNase YbeY (16S rRNA maturation enzyme)
MIKINVILNNIIWKKYLTNPHDFIDNKVKLLNKKNKLFKKNTLICSLLLSDTKEIKSLNKKFRNKN